MHAFVQHQAFARFGFVGDQARGRRWHSSGSTAMPRSREPVAQAGRKGFAAGQALAHAGNVAAGFLRLLDQDAQEARRAHVGIGPQFGDRLQLLLGLADAGREHGAAHRVRARFHDEGAGRHVVAEGVVDQVAGAEPGREHGAPGTPVVGRGAFGLVDRAGRGKQAGHARAAPQRGETAEPIAGACAFCRSQQFVFARDRQPRQRLARGDARGIDAGQDLGKGRAPAAHGPPAAAGRPATGLRAAAGSRVSSASK